MINNGKRQLRDITDQELRVIVEMSGRYGHKDYWGNFTITDIDRNMFKNSIVIDYEQTRISDGGRSHFGPVKHESGWLRKLNNKEDKQ